MNSSPEAERYTLFLNPYPEHRFTRCPRCGSKTSERTRILVVQPGPKLIVPAMLACGYCTSCDLLIAHKNELVMHLHEILPTDELETLDDEKITIVGTLDRSRLRGGGIEDATLQEIMEAFHPIRELVHFDIIQDEAGSTRMVETALPLTSMRAEIAVPSLDDVQALPQVEETWQMAALQMWTWIANDEEEPYRPHMVLVVGSTSVGPLLIFQEMMKSEPSPAEVLDVLLKAMGYPAPGAGEPRRPSVMVTDDEELADALQPELAALGIRCITEATPELDDIFADLEDFLAGGIDPHPGLLDDPRVTPGQVGELFEAAADFYREAPWELMLDEDLIALRYPVREGEWRFASVMGNAGLSYGLAIFEDLFDYDLLATTPPEASVGMMTYRSLTYEDMTAVPFSDLDAIEYYGWEVAADDAYPIPAIFTEDEEVIRPGPEEIEWYTVALRAIQAFFEEYWPDEIDYVPEDLSRMFTVPLENRTVEVELRYPAELVIELDE